MKTVRALWTEQNIKTDVFYTIHDLYETHLFIGFIPDQKSQCKRSKNNRYMIVRLPDGTIIPVAGGGYLTTESYFLKRTGTFIVFDTARDLHRWMAGEDELNEY